jgi:branched-chain amino acid transport system permease protein
MAVGGYAIAITTTRYHWNPWLGLLLGAVAAAALALVIGLPLLRLRGHYLAMGTFALALGTSSLATALPITGGAIGISAVPPLTIGPISFQDQTNAYWLCWGVVALALAVFATLNWSYVGRAWRALALREDVAAGLGVNIHGYKTLAFVIAAVMAAVAGSLYVAITSFVAPDIYDTTIAINLFVILFIGGRGTLFGPVLGSMVVVIGPQFFAGISSWQNVIFLLLLLLVILFMPQGVLGGGQTLPPLRSWPAAARLLLPRRQGAS